MSQLSLQSPVGDWVAALPLTSRVFETLRIDYCCHGKLPLEQACWEQKLDPDSVLASLEFAACAPGGVAPRDWRKASLAELCEHIEATHHAYLKSELPRLHALLEKVIAAHGDAHPELAGLQAVFADFRAELEPHMCKEERILFPAIRLLDRAGTNPAFPFGTVANPIRMMEREHDNAGDALARIRELTDDYRAPQDACASYRALYDALRELEEDLHRHVHKENNILFPRAFEREQELLPARR
jgi:regulator of cell morphogenesis and NO signaling